MGALNHITVNTLTVNPQWEPTEVRQYEDADGRADGRTEERTEERTDGRARARPARTDGTTTKTYGVLMGVDGILG